MGLGSAEGRGFSDTERYLFDLRGYVVRHGVVDPPFVTVLRQAADALVVRPPGADLASQRFDGLLDTIGPFDELLDHPDALALLREVCGPTVRLDHAYGITMAPGTAGLGLHGGGTPHDPAQSYQWHDGRMWNGLVGVMWGLAPSGPGDGGFCCIPGSHKANLPLPDDLATDIERAEGPVVEVPLPPGSMLLFSEALTHGTLPWRGREPRCTVVFKYAPGHLAWNPGPGYRPDIFGEIGSQGLVRPEHGALRTGRRRALLHPPYEPYHPQP